jgi:hypothetical protein
VESAYRYFCSCTLASPQMLWWLDHVGTGMKIFASGRKRCMKSAISRQLPVPDRLWTEATRPSAMAAACSPYASFTLCAQNSADPPGKATRGR